MLSGVGPATHLKEHGIEVVHDAEGVGANLQDHLQVRMVFRLNWPISLNGKVNNIFRSGMMGIPYALTRTGPLTIGRTSCRETEWQYVSIAGFAGTFKNNKVYQTTEQHKQTQS